MNGKAKLFIQQEYLQDFNVVGMTESEVEKIHLEKSLLDDTRVPKMI